MQKFVLALAVFLALPTYAQTVASVSGSMREQKMAPKDIAAQSEDALKQMKVVLREIFGKLEEARKAKDVVRVNCINEKLTQIKGLVRIADQSHGLLRAATARSDLAESDTEFSKVMVAKTKVDQLRSEAEQCMGEVDIKAGSALAIEVAQEPVMDPTRNADRPDIVVRVPPSTPTPIPDPLVLTPPASPTL